MEARAEAELEDLERESNEAEAAYYAAKSSGKAEDIRKLREAYLQSVKDLTDMKDSYRMKYPMNPKFNDSVPSQGSGRTSEKPTTVVPRNLPRLQLVGQHPIDAHYKAHPSTRSFFNDFELELDVHTIDVAQERHRFLRRCFTTQVQQRYLDDRIKEYKAEQLAQGVPEKELRMPPYNLVKRWVSEKFDTPLQKLLAWKKIGGHPCPHVHR